MAKKVKEPNRPPYVHATGPTDTIVAVDDDHDWVKGELKTFHRIPHREWACPCGAFGYSVELIPK